MFGVLNCNNTILGNKIQIGVGASFPVGYSALTLLQPAGVYSFQGHVVSLLRGAIPIPTFDNQATFPANVCGPDTTTEVLRAFEVFLGCNTSAITGVTCAAVKSLSAATNCRPSGNVQVYAFYDGLPMAYQPSIDGDHIPACKLGDPGHAENFCGSGALAIGDAVPCDGETGNCTPPFVAATIDALQLPDV